MVRKIFLLFLSAALLIFISSCSNPISSSITQEEESSSRAIKGLKPKAVAVLAGLKSVNPSSYGGWNGVSGCWGCEKDVDRMTSILRPIGYSIKTLKTAQATRSAILNEIDKASRNLYAGDIFVFYYSGHGGSIYDSSGDEADGKDETLCAYDGQIVDDELNQKWIKFRSGVRIVMLSDSCHSGTVYKNRVENIIEVKTGMKASLIHISGCRDPEFSSGYKDGGAFTKAIEKVWNQGAGNGNYKSFHSAIAKNVTTDQNPEYHEYGPVNSSFRNSKPFSIVSDKYKYNWGTSNMGQGYGNLGFLTGDVNGDGKEDLIHPWDNGGKLGLITYLSNGKSHYTAWGTGNMGQGSGSMGFLTGDVNGDGKTDIIHPWNNGGKLGLITYLSNGRGYKTAWGTSNMGQGSGTMGLLTGDVNGDGKTDIIQPWNNGGKLGLITYLSNGKGYKTAWGTSNMGQGSGNLGFLTGDVNGDGKTDIIHPWNNGGKLGLITYLSNGRGYKTAWGASNMGQGSGNLGFLTGDINGDGKTDIIQPWNNNGKLGLITYLSNGRGYKTAWGISNTWQTSSNIRFMTGDINKDGKVDLIQTFNNNGRLGIKTYLSNGRGLEFYWGSNNMKQGSGNMGLLAGDINGDGKTDIIQPWRSSNKLGLINYLAK